MSDFITIKNGYFTADLNLDEIHQLTVVQWRKLLKLAVRQIWDNAGAVQHTMDWLDDTGIPGAKNQLDDAQKDMDTDTWSLKGLSQDEKDEARRHNAWLKSRVISARRRIEQLAKLRAIITETVPADEIEYWLK